MFEHAPAMKDSFINLASLSEGFSYLATSSSRMFTQGLDADAAAGGASFPLDERMWPLLQGLVQASVAHLTAQGEEPAGDGLEQQVLRNPTPGTAPGYGELLTDGGSAASRCGRRPRLGHCTVGDLGACGTAECRELPHGGVGHAHARMMIVLTSFGIVFGGVTIPRSTSCQL